jgi:hypothetical protein
MCERTCWLPCVSKAFVCTSCMLQVINLLPIGLGSYSNFMAAIKVGRRPDQSIEDAQQEEISTVLTTTRLYSQVQRKVKLISKRIASRFFGLESHSFEDFVSQMGTHILSTSAAKPFEASVIYDELAEERKSNLKEASKGLGVRRAPESFLT